MPCTIISHGSLSSSARRTKNDFHWLGCSSAHGIGRRRLIHTLSSSMIPCATHYKTNMSPSTNGVTAVSHSDINTVSNLSLQHHHASTLAIHADDRLNRTTDVSPALHVSTTFRYSSDPDDLVPAKEVTVSIPTFFVLERRSFLLLSRTSI